MKQRGIEIYVCGNNAWRQLEIPAKGGISWTSVIGQLGTGSQLLDILEEPEDFGRFRKVLSLEEEERVLGIWAGLSWTVVKTSSYLYCAGQFDQDFPTPESSDFNTIGISGTGTLQSSEDFLSLIATLPNCRHSEDDLKVRQLVANQACWTVLCHDGSVWTWGDARFPSCLGREVDEENPSSTPTIIPVLLPSNINSTVTKIASGGYITAALTSAHDIYIWGSPDPASSHPIIPDLSGDPTPLIIPDPQDPSHEFDFSDIGIGAKHVIILTTDQRLLVTGNNANGQLGIIANEEEAADIEFIRQWKEVEIPSSAVEDVEGEDTMPRNGRAVVGVAAGGNASFVILGCRSSRE